MKRLLASLSLIMLVGAGCFGGDAADQPVVEEGPSTHYESEQYGFQFDHSEAIEARVREEAQRPTVHVGIPVDFFISVRDIEREEKPVNLAYFYAAQDTTVDQFVAALEASDPAIQVKTREPLTVNDIPMTKITNTTALGSDKTYYLFDGKDGSLIIVSVFISEEANFEPVLQALKKF